MATMYYYAYLNDKDIVEQIFDMPAPISSPQYISIPSHDETLIGKRYNRTTGEFEEVINYVQVTEEDRNFWNNDCIKRANVRVSNLDVTTPEYTVSIPYDSGKPGYLPKRIVLQVKGKSMGGYEVMDYLGGTSITMEQKDNGKKSLYVHFDRYDIDKTTSESKLSATCSAYADDPSNFKTLTCTVKDNKFTSHVGTEAFFTSSYLTGTGRVYIGCFDYTDKEITFKLTLDPTVTKVRLNLSGAALIF